MVRLRIHVGNRDPIHLDLEAGVFTLGRGDDNSIVVDLPSLDLRQVEIRVTETLQVFVKNLTDRHELSVNGHVRLDSFVKPGDIVTSAGVVLMVELLEGSEGASDDAAPMESGFGRSLIGAFRYPLDGDTIFVLVAITLVGALANFFGGLMRWVGIILGFGIGIYLVLVFREIVLTTIRGEDKMPSEPPISFDWEELKELLLPLYAMVLFPMLPFILVGFWPDAPVWLRPTLGVMAFLYIPMGMLLLLVTDEILAAHPGNVLLSVVRAPMGYLGVLGVSIPVAGIGYLIEMTTSRFGAGNRYMAIGLSSLLGLLEVYLVFVWARVLGLFYRFHRHRLGWEETD